MTDEEDIEEVSSPAVQKANFQNASLLNALESKFSEIQGKPSGYLSQLPFSVRRRLDALRNLTKESLKIDKEFSRLVNEIERKIATNYL